MKKISPRIPIPTPPAPGSERSCAHCKYLHIVNERRVYAICTWKLKVFEMWGEDARHSKCESWEHDD